MAVKKGKKASDYINLRMSNENIADIIDNLFAVLKFKGNVEGDTRLSEPEENAFYELIIGLWNKQPDYRAYYDDCRDAIIACLRKYDYSPRTPRKAKVGNGMSKLPYVVKILLWCMAFRAHDLYAEYEKDVKENKRKKDKTIKKPSDQAILKLIEENSQGNEGYSLSKKTFTYFAISPARYYEIIDYKQIYLPVKYAGSKNGYLGYALNYLVEFAGVHDNYLDIFAGSGYAYLALNLKNYVSYYINEYNFFNVNYYYVMKSDKLFPMFMKRLEDLKKHLGKCKYNNMGVCTCAKIGGKCEYSKYDEDTKEWIYDRDKGKCKACLFDVDEAKKVFDRCKEIGVTWSAYTNFDIDRQNGVVKNVGIDADAESVSRLGIGMNTIFYEKESDETKVDAALAFVFFSSFVVTGGKHERGGISASKLYKFVTEENDFKAAHAKFAKLRWIYNSDALGSGEFIVEEFRDKASALYEDYDDIIRALRVNPSLAEVMNIKEIDVDSDEFSRIEALAGRLGYSEKEEKEEEEEKEEGKEKGKEEEEEEKKGKVTRPYTTLYYSDSPYLGTTDYKNNNKKDKEIGGIDDKSMCKLIDRLLEATRGDYSGNHFIFSCRTTISKADGGFTTMFSLERLDKLDRDKDNDNGVILRPFDTIVYNSSGGFKDSKKTIGDILEILTKNQSIYENLFKYFEEKSKDFGGKELYVLCCFDRSKEEAVIDYFREDVPDDIKNDDAKIKDYLEKEVPDYFLIWALKQLYVGEIFITDFDYITPLEYVSYIGSVRNKNDYVYKKYGIEQFCDILYKNMLRSKKYENAEIDPKPVFNEILDKYEYKLCISPKAKGSSVSKKESSSESV